MEKQATVIVFDDHEVQGAVDAEVCFCGGMDSDECVMCKKCKTSYHDWCVDFVDVEKSKRNHYECGFCCDEPDSDGVRMWDGPINNLFDEDLNDQTLFRNDNELMYQGKGKRKKRIRAEVQGSWADVVARVNKVAEDVHRAKKEKYDKAVA